MSNQSFDPVWQQIYADGHSNRYPYDAIVSFVFANRQSDSRLLEVGCGTGNNLWFAAREGVQVVGVDASENAINKARQRFAAEDLCGEFYVADFTSLPLDDNSVDLVIDRAALTCADFEGMQQAINEISRVLKPGGRFMFNPYSDSHSSSRSGDYSVASGTVSNISAGNIVDVGQICFCSLKDIYQLFAEGWTFLSIQRAETTEMLTPAYHLHSEWRVVVEKSTEVSD
jgi:ubiquinone/menaquinone biosynthesis C-methylase UbiE